MVLAGKKRKREKRGQRRQKNKGRKMEKKKERRRKEEGLSGNQVAPLLRHCGGWKSKRRKVAPKKKKKNDPALPEVMPRYPPKRNPVILKAILGRRGTPPIRVSR